MTARKKTSKRYLVTQEEETNLKHAQKHLGIPGRMMYRSKSMGKPTTIFNSYIFDDKGLNIWAGDIEIEQDQNALLSLSKQIGALYILPESAIWGKSRWTIEAVQAGAHVIVEKGTIAYSEEFERWVEFKKKLNKSKKGGN